MSRNETRIETLKYITAVFIYGTIGPILHYISLPSEIVVCCRGIIGSLFILCYMKIKDKQIDFKAIKNNLVPLLISGVCLGLNWVFLFAAYLHTTVAIASLFNYLAPVMVVLIAPFAFKEKLKTKKLLCVFVALAGVVLTSGIIGNKIENINFLGMGLAVLAAIMFIGIVICNKKLKDIGSYDKALVQLIVSAITVLPYAIYSNYGKELVIDLHSILLIAMLGIIHTGLAYIFYFSALGTISVQSIAILGYLEPVVSVLGSVFVLKEAMGTHGYIGAIMIIGAALASELL